MDDEQTGFVVGAGTGRDRVFEIGAGMLEQNQFQMKALLLGNKLSGLWLFVYQALTLGVTPERLAAITRVMSEVNRLHREMFPEFEHALYSDDLLSMVEGDEAV